MESETSQKILNIKAKTYDGRFLEAGIIKYSNETVLIKNENLFDIAHTFKGCPVFIGHQSIKKDEKDLKEKAVGYISKVFIQDGWAWCNFVIDDKKANELIEDGYSLSCSHIPTSFGIGGKYHNIKFDREIITAKGTHIAIVKNPRYEDVIIYENSKKTESKIMKNIFKFVKKEINNSKEKKLELENSFVEVEGKEVPMSEMIEAYNSIEESKKKAEEEKKNVLDLESEVMVGDKKVKVSELVNSYKEFKNECDKKAEEEKKVKEEEDEEKKVKEEEKKEEDKKKEEEEKKNSADFNKIKKNKAEAELKNSKTPVKEYVSESEKYEMGQNRYGSAQVINKKK